LLRSANITQSASDLFYNIIIYTECVHIDRVSTVQSKFLCQNRLVLVQSTHCYTTQRVISGSF